MNYDASVKIEIKKLEQRWITRGRWGVIFDFIPVGNRQRKTDMIFGILGGPCAGFASLVLFFMVVLVGRILNGIGLEQPFSPVEMVILFAPSVLTLIAFPTFALCEPANSKTICDFKDFLKDHPEFVHLAGKWVGRRGFLTARDTFLIRKAQHQASRQLTRRSVVSTMHAGWTRVDNWIGRNTDKFKQKARARRDERRDQFSNTLLGSYVDAEHLKQQTPKTPTSPPKARL